MLQGLNEREENSIQGKKYMTINIALKFLNIVVNTKVERIY